MSRRLVDVPARPTRIIQFGEGNFLRGFLEWQVQRMCEAGVWDGGVAIVQPRAGGHVARLEEQDRLYTVLLEGIQDGAPVRDHEVITVVNQTVDPYRDWEGFLALADNPDARVIVSNTTEAGIAIDPTDTARTIPPRGFPAKLAHLLHRRFRAGLPGFLVLPCELVDDNGTKLQQTVLRCVREFGLGADLERWILSRNRFCSTLVDRIVPGYPAQQAEELWRELGYEDRQMVKAEPFASWAIEGPEGALDDFPLRAAGLDVVLTQDLRPYHDRKVYLLNAPHTTMACLARPAGFHTVGEVMADHDFRAFVRAEMHEEIFPAIDLPGDALESFAAQVLERFENPSVHHSLESIALNSVSKFSARLVPIVRAALGAGRPLPRRVCLALAGLLAIYGRLAGAAAPPIDSPEVLAAFQKSTAGKPGDESWVRAVLADTTLWGEDLTALPGLAGIVAADLVAIGSEGVMPSVRRLA